MSKKILTAFSVSVALSIFYFLAGGLAQDSLIYSVIVFAYAAIGTTVYGIPVSYISGWLTRNIGDYRLLVAGVMHLFFGAVTVFFLQELAIFAVISSFLFFVMDEWLHQKVRQRKKVLVSSLAILVFLAVAIFTAIKTPPLFQEKTNMIYLIPEDFEGPVIVFYSEPNQPRLETEGAFQVVPVETAMLEEKELYGVNRTSSPISHGIISNQYYYVNQAGERTTISDDCVSFEGGGSFSGSDGRNATYEMLQITNSECGENFLIGGNERYSQLTERVLLHLLER